MLQSSGLLQLSSSGDLLLLSFSAELRFVLAVVFLALFDADFDSVMAFKPGLEWIGVDLDDASFDDSLGSQKLVVRGVISDIQDTSFASAYFRSPREISRIKRQSPLLDISTAASDERDLLSAQLGVGWLSTELKLALLLVDLALATGVSLLVSSTATDSHFSTKIDGSQIQSIMAN